MPANVVTSLALGVGDELDDERRLRIEREVVGEEALGYAVRLCSRRLYSVAQIRAKLEGREYPVEMIDQALQRLHDMLLLDDERFADEWCNDARLKGQWGDRAADYLRTAGIERKVAVAAIERRFPADCGDDEAARLVVQRYGEGPLDYKDGTKAFQFLIRRGFPYEAAEAAVERTRR